MWATGDAMHRRRCIHLLSRSLLVCLCCARAYGASFWCLSIWHLIHFQVSNRVLLIFLRFFHLFFCSRVTCGLQRASIQTWLNCKRIGSVTGTIDIVFLCVAIVELIYHFWCLSEFVLNLFSFENRLECARVMNSQSLVQLETSILCANVCFLFDACTRYACQYVTRSYLHTRSKQKWLISSVGLQLHRGTKKRAVYSSIASESILIYSMFLFLTLLFSFMFRIPISRYNVRARRGGKHALSFGTHQ